MISRSEVKELFSERLIRLVARANEIHRQNYPEGLVQLSSLLSVKTGGCPENCSYCPQSAHFNTGVKREKLLSTEAVRQAALQAKEKGATRFCMGAAWREVKEGPEFDHVLNLVKEVKNIGLQVCCTLGMVNESQASRLKDAGLYAYNHNIDSSRNFYSKIISTRTYDDRLRTIDNVRRAGLTVCTGGILGMGESEEDRAELLRQLASFAPHPESITINTLIAIPGTPLESRKPVTALELVRVVATARILMPKSMIRLSAGRRNLSDEAQFLCFLAGANSIFFGDKLLTSANPSVEEDFALLFAAGVYPAEGYS